MLNESFRKFQNLPFFFLLIILIALNKIMDYELMHIEVQL